MSVDPYGPCPCGSGKKLKFCCSDLVGDIEKVHRKIEGDQPRAALQDVEQALTKRPARPSLLDLKAFLEVSLHELEAANATIEEFQRVDPENPSAHAQEAILHCAQTKPLEAVEPLQRALALIQGEMPQRLLEAIGVVGHGLLVSRNVLAARAHLWLYQGIVGSEDTRAFQLLVQINQSGSLPLLLRDHLHLQEAPSGHPAESDHNLAQVLASRGQWLPAARLFDQLCAQYDDVASFHYNRALLHGWLGDCERFAESMHEFARREMPLEEAVEAEALAQLLDPAHREPATEIVRVIYDLLDEEEMVARLARNQCLAQYPGAPSDLVEEDRPAPRYAYLLLDRPMPALEEDLTLEATPRIAGLVLQFGRQTDRAERLEVILDKDGLFDTFRNQIEELGQGALGTAIPEERFSLRESNDDPLGYRLHYPPGAGQAIRDRIEAEARQEYLLRNWPEKPKAALGGKTPREASGEPSLRVALLASLLIIEQEADSTSGSEIIAQIREELSLPALEPISSSGIDADHVPLGRIPRIVASELSDDAISALFQRASIAGAQSATARLGSELVLRPALAERHNLGDVYRRLIALERDPIRGLDLLQRARDQAEATGESSAFWDLLELKKRLVVGEVDEVQRLVQHLLQEHSDETEIMEELYEFLYSIGAIREPSELQNTSLPSGIESPDAPSTPDTSQIWTPNPGEPQGVKQKIWTPS